MTAKVVNLKDLAKELKIYTDREIENFKNSVLGGIAKSIPMLVERSPVDTGLFAQSWAFSKEEWGAILGNYAPHAPIIEYGARPFTPPLEPLLAWAKRVLGDPSQPPNYSPQVRALAMGTQQKIARVGMAPKHIMQDAIPEIIENIRKEYQSLDR